MDEFPGLKYKVAHSIRKDGFTANINFIDEPFSDPLDDYVSTNLKGMNNVFVDLIVMSQDEFLTNEGERGIKLVTENTQNVGRLRQTFYFLSTGDRGFVITYSRLPDSGVANDDLVDKSIKTFRIEQ